jgi:hypothetical protein
VKSVTDLGRPNIGNGGDDERMFVFGELERIGKEVVVAYFRLLSHNSPGGTIERIENPQYG